MGFTRAGVAREDAVHGEWHGLHAAGFALALYLHIVVQFMDFRFHAFQPDEFVKLFESGLGRLCLLRCSLLFFVFRLYLLRFRGILLVANFIDLALYLFKNGRLLCGDIAIGFRYQ